MPINNPYFGLSAENWLAKTNELIATHPIPSSSLVEITKEAWREVFATKVGTAGYQIGVDILPQPQIIGFLLHELIPLLIAARYSGWRRDVGGTEKDVVCEFDPSYSIEIKTSSNLRNIFGNRSYAQQGGDARREKDGYLLAVNFQGFRASRSPELVRIRFGWIDHTDWVGQTAQTGQQAHLSREANHLKLLELLK